MEPDGKDEATFDDERDSDDAASMHDVDVREDTRIGDDVDIAVAVISPRPVDVRVNTEVDQNGEMDQDADVAAETGDGEGRAIGIGTEQRPEVEQATTLDAHIGDGPPGSTVEVDQDLELEQDVAIDIDIEDDLEERYIIKVAVETIQQVDAEQMQLSISPTSMAQSTWMWMPRKPWRSIRKPSCGPISPWPDPGDAPDHITSPSRHVDGRAGKFEVGCAKTHRARQHGQWQAKQVMKPARGDASGRALFREPAP
ncbi:MAG: hypothetical protein WBA88_14140 [Pseudaminobacter sp.]